MGVCDVTGHATVTASFMSLHVTPYRECLAAAIVGASERLLARVAVTVDLQAGWPAEGFVACGANVSILRLWECSRR